MHSIRRPEGINPNGIRHGDPIWVRDRSGIAQTGTANLDDLDELMMEPAPPGKINVPIARWDPTHGYVVIEGIKILGWVPQLEFET